MRSAEVRAHLDALALTATDAARLLGVGLRSVRRWTQPGSELPSQGAGVGVAAAAPWPVPQAPQPAVDPEGAGAADATQETHGPDDTNTSVARSPELIPGPAAQALSAWLKLHRLGAHWRPDGLALVDVDPLAALERVRARGGLRTASHWDVDLRRGCASMGGHRVSFVWPGRAPGSAPGTAPGTASSATSAAVPEVMGWALQSYCPERSGAGAANTAGGRLFVRALAELVDDACASIARRLAGERAPPLPVLVLGEPAWVGDVGEAVELRDESFSPSVVCRLGTAALGAFLELPTGAASGITPAQLLAFARRHHATLTELAGELHARPSRGTTSLGQRLLDIGAGDLGLVRARLGWPVPGAAASAAPGATLGPPAAGGRHETARAPATAVAVAGAGEDT